MGICPTTWAVCPGFRTLRSRLAGSRALVLVSLGRSFWGPASVARFPSDPHQEFVARRILAERPRDIHGESRRELGFITIVAQQNDRRAAAFRGEGADELDPRQWFRPQLAKHKVNRLGPCNLQPAIRP